MASAVTVKCFPTPNCCDNCNRKLCNLYTTDKPKTKLKNAHDKETGNTESKSKSESSSQQEIRKKENCHDKHGKNDNKTKSEKDINKTEFRLKSENSSGKDEKGNTMGGKCKTDDDKKERMDSKTGDKKVFKRCTGCFLMTYCDKTCQKEHWIRVHKYHCAHLSGKKVSDKHQENSCEECIANETASKDELFDINSPKIGCRIKEESNRMRRELGVLFGFHGDGQLCNCGNQFACEHPFPIGKIQGSAVSTGLDEMIVHAAKLCNAFIIKAMKANEKKDTIDLLLVLHKNILRCRVELWFQILVCGDILAIHLFTELLIDSGRDVSEKVDTEKPWWKALQFSLACILRMALSREFIQLAEGEITDATHIGKYDYHQKNVKNVSMISKNNLWHRFKLWPSKINNSLVLCLPKYVFCSSCNADLSGQVVGLVHVWDPSKPSPSLFGGVADNGGVIATCSPFRNSDCGEGYCDKTEALQVSAEENQEHQALLEKTRVCHVCLKLSSSSHRCTKCFASQYCSKDCQEADWNDFHSTVCSTWAEDPARKLMSSKKQKEITKEHVKTIDKTFDKTW